MVTGESLRPLQPIKHIFSQKLLTDFAGSVLQATVIARFDETLYRSAHIEYVYGQTWK